MSERAEVPQTAHTVLPDRPPRAYRRTAGRLLAILLASGVTWWAVEGGAYPSHMLVLQQSRIDDLVRDTMRLRAETDSFRVIVQHMRDDRLLQEQIARELYGYVRGDEVLYRFAEPEGSAGGGVPTAHADAGRPTDHSLVAIRLAAGQHLARRADLEAVTSGTPRHAARTP